MLPGGYVVKLVGEAYYQPALDWVCGGRTEDGHARECTVLLVPEPRNPHDRNAIGGWIDGAQVGHLSREDARRFQPVARQLAEHSAVGACAALILGGWDRGYGDTGHYGVTLSVASPAQCLQHLDGHQHLDEDPWRVLRHEPGYRIHAERAQTRAAEAAAQVDRRYYTEWVPTLDKLRSEKRDDEALTLLLEVITAAERWAAIMGQEPPASYTERAAVIYRRRRDYAAEIAILERWLAACPPDRSSSRISERLAKARQLAATEGGTR